MTDAELNTILDKHVERDYVPDLAILSSMREASKREAIEFAEWIGKNSYDEVDKGKWFDFFGKLHTTEQVYELYLKSLSN